jgi:hypothetical protein
VEQFPLAGLLKLKRIHQECFMKKYLTMAVGAAFAAAATLTYAQTPTPPGTDRPAGEEGGTSAKPNMDKKQGTGTKAAPKTGGTPTPPGTDRPAGESGGTSASPNPDKKK